jgi:acyl-CoA synthetase (AMP-forming)/AMP-acid ligase II
VSQTIRDEIARRQMNKDTPRARAAYAAGWWVDGTLADALEYAARHTPQRVLLIDADRRIDCRELYVQARALAHALRARMPTGSVISFMLPNWHEAAIIYLAATFAGMVINPILPSLRERELRFILEDASCRMIFVPASLRQQDTAALLSRVSAQLSQPPVVVVLRGPQGPHTSFTALLASKDTQEHLPALDPDAVRLLLYTSGTTGRAKGVLHTHNTLHALICQIRDHWRVEPGDRFLVPSPIAHIGGSIYAFECPLLVGTTAVLMERWQADTAVQLMQAEGCTHMAGATPFLQQLLAAARSAATRLPQLKVFVCGGASVPASLVHDAAGYFERAVVTRVYGSTEVPITTVGATLTSEATPAAETDGRAGIAELKLMAHPSARRDEGEICARGPQMLVGYLHEADEIEAFDAEGFFRTGDLARWVDDRYLLVTGRAKDIIIRNGENIAPKEVEDLLLDHPLIAEIAIVGVPDPRTGERACAVIVPRSVPGPDVASLRSFLDALGVATFKVPEQVVIAAALPRNDAGKVLKHQLRSLLAPTSES